MAEPAGITATRTGYSEIATLYVWKRNKIYDAFDIGEVMFCLGGALPPTRAELEAHHVGKSVRFSDTLRVYCASREDEMAVRKKVASLPFSATAYDEQIERMQNTCFSTVMLEERLKALDLPLPNHKVTFMSRDGMSQVDTAKVAGIAALLDGFSGLDVLATLGTDIEGIPLYASTGIAERLAAQSAAPREASQN